MGHYDSCYAADFQAEKKKIEKRYKKNLYSLVIFAEWCDGQDFDVRDLRSKAKEALAEIQVGE